MNWETIPLKDFIEIMPSVKLVKGEKYSFIPMDIVEEDVRYVLFPQKKTYSGGGSKFCSGDTIFARITPCLENGKIAKVNKLETNCGFGSTEFFVFRAKPNISIPNYVYYLAKSDIIRQPAIKSMVGASGRQRADKNVVQNIRVFKLPISSQQKIVSILSPYDDLIENNLKRIKLLEESAQMIYKEWFVNFRFPGYKNTKFVDGLPEGWQMKTSSSIANFQNGYAFKPSDWKHRGIPIIKINELKNGICTSTPKSDLNGVPKKYLIANNEILFSWSADLGVYWWTRGEGVLNQHLFKVVPLDETQRYYIFFVLKNLVSVFKTKVVGTTMQHIRKSALDEVYCIVPDFSTIERFTKIIKPIVDQQVVLTNQLQNLRQARDLLLPKLMTGEIEV